jgi:hypothetical protein
MSISMYQASLPVLIRGLTNLQHILGKAQAHAAEKQIDPSVFIGARLYPDMLPLVRQVYIATDTAKAAPRGLPASISRAIRTSNSRSTSCMRASRRRSTI